MTPLREIFDGAVERYDAARPGYPTAMVADLVELAELRTGSPVLEIGCGTGQLTVPLAEAGLTVTAVELGAALAAVARRKLAAHPDARVVVGAFEDTPVPDGAFDLVVAATAFHWVDEAVRVPKAVRALRPGGRLAVVDTEHVAGGNEDFFSEVQGCYRRWDPATPPGLRLTPADEIPTARPELDGSPLLEPVELRRYTAEITYTAAQYRQVPLTYSGHLALAPDLRAGLLHCVTELIDRRYGGAITKRYLTELRVARRRENRMTSARARATLSAGRRGRRPQVTGNEHERHLCLFCGRLVDRTLICCGPRQDIAICLDCAELAVGVIRTGLPSST